MSYLDARVRILAYMRSHPSGVTASQVRTMAPIGRNLNTDDVRSVLAELIREGRATSRVEQCPMHHGCHVKESRTIYYATLEAI